MEISKAIQEVQKAAEADTTGTGQRHVDLLESIQKLRLVAEKPAETLMRMRLEPLTAAAVRLAVEGGFLETIGAAAGNPVTACAIATKTGYEELLIARVLRLVTKAGVCDEVGEREYVTTEATQIINTPGISGGVKHYYDLFFPIGANLVDYMKRTGFPQFPKKPEQKNAFESTFNMELFDYFEKTPDQRKYFDDYMSVRREGLSSWYEVFPMASYLGTGVSRDDPETVLLVDVGGNWGHELRNFHKAHSEVPGRLILQDLPVMIDKFKGNPPPGLELMTYDFFDPQPIKGARAYYFRQICHDWSDEACRKILLNTASAMKKGYSRILIDDFVLPNTGASFRGASLDFLMMCFLGAIERTRRQWDELLDSCGLEIVKVWGNRTDYEQIIEVQLKA